MNDLELILETAHAIFRDACAPHVVRNAEGSWVPDLWATLDDLGFTRIGIPESDGGGGGSFSDAAAVVRVAASHAAPVPLAETLIAAAPAAAAGFELIPGPMTVARGRPLEVRRSGAGATVRGRLARVPWAGVAERLVVISDAAAAALVIELSECDVRLRPNLAGEPHADLDIDVKLDLAAVRDLPDGWSEDRVALSGATIRAAQIAGALNTICDLTLRYTTERRQFKRPIGSFQAVQQQAAVLAGLATAVTVGSEAAAAEVTSPVAVASAKAYASSVSGPATMIAHEVHGAIGFTAEYHLQLFTRRVWSWRDECGNETYWGNRLGKLLEICGAEDTWSVLAGP